MPTKVAFVVAIGRLSSGNETALPKIKSICSQYGGSVTGGVGSSADPVVAVFADPANAAKAAQQAWYLDDVEAAKVLGTDAPGPIETPAGDVPGAAPDRGNSQYPLDYGIKEAVAEVVEAKKSVTEAVDALLAAPVVEKKEDKKEDKEDKKEDKGEDKKVDEAVLTLDDDCAMEESEDEYHNLDHTHFTTKVRLPKFNADTSATMPNTARDAARAFVRAGGKVGKDRAKALADYHYQKAEEHRQAWGTAADTAAQATFNRPFSSEDYRVSGIGRDEFSDADKDTLRNHAHSRTKHDRLSQMFTYLAKHGRTSSPA